MTVLELLHDDGQPIIVGLLKVKTTGEKEWINHEVRSLEEARRVTLAANRRHVDAYVKHAVFTGDKTETGKVLCDLTHIVGSRAFVVDVDSGPADKFLYKTPAEALAATAKAIGALRQKINLPPPSILTLTGNGIHAVWVLTEVIPPAEWRVLQGTLYGLLKREGLSLDTAMAAMDKAVRMCGPDFFNHKNGGQLPTRILKVNDGRIDADLWRSLLMPFRLQLASDGGVRKVQDEWSIDDGSFTFSVADTIPHCGVLGNAYTTQGLRDGYELWTSLLSIASRDSDAEAGTAWAHHFSMAHPDYKPTEVDYKLDSYRKSGSAFITCERFSSLSPACQSCRFRTKVKSPAGIAKVLRDEAGLPDPRYYNSPEGVKLHGAEEGREIIWPGYNILDIELVRVIRPDVRVAEEEMHFNIDAVGSAHSTRLEIPVKDLSTKTKLQHALGARQHPIVDVDAPKVQRAMSSWLTKLKARKETKIAYDRLGWVSEDSFALGNMIFHPTMQSPLVPRGELAPYVPHGDQSMWRAVADMMLQYEARPEAHALVAASFGAPLAKLAGLTGCVLNFYSEASGHGKSALIKLAASVWGRPSSLVNSADDTMASLAAIAGRLNNLPVYFDEVRTDSLSDDLQKLVFRADSGKVRNRCAPDGTVLDRREWATLFTFAANFSMGTVLRGRNDGGDAAVARYIDFPMPPLSYNAHLHDDYAMMRALTTLDSNNGFPGYAYAEEMVRKRGTLLGRLDEVSKYLRTFAQIRPGDTAGRLHVGSGACIVVAAEMVEAAGIAPINSSLVWTCIENALTRTRKLRGDAQLRMSPEMILAEFLKVTEANRIVTLTSRGAKALAYDIRPALPVAYEISKGDGTLIVDVARLIHYLDTVKQTVNVLDYFEQKGLRKPYAIGRGTPYGSASRDALVIKLDPSAPQPWDHLFDARKGAA